MIQQNILDKFAITPRRRVARIFCTLRAPDPGDLDQQQYDETEQVAELYCALLKWRAPWSPEYNPSHQHKHEF